ncbi:hypothetical protein ACFL4W_05325 [Planctomycetota bacterium]
MNAIFEAAKELEDFYRAQEWQACIIGGLAVTRWGEPRATQDVDISLLTGFGNEKPFIDCLLDRFEARIDDAAQFALANRVLLIKASNGIPIDISMGGIPFEEALISRATPFEFAPDTSLTTCSAEDLIVLKAFAARSRDWGDVESIIARQGASLDFDYIFLQLAPLVELKNQPEILHTLTALKNELAE